MNEIQKADKTLRRNVLVILAIGLLLGSIPLYTLQLYQKELETWLLYNGEYFIKNPEIISIALYLFSLPVLAVSVYFWFLSDRIIVCGRFPPTGQKVIRDTIVYYGDAALKRAYILKFMCVVLFTAALSIPIVISFVIHQLSMVFIM